MIDNENKGILEPLRFILSLCKSEDKRAYKCITINSLAKNLTKIFIENTPPPKIKRLSYNYLQFYNIKIWNILLIRSADTPPFRFIIRNVVSVVHNVIKIVQMDDSSCRIAI